MTDTKKPKILILESNESISNHARGILTKVGFDVHCEVVSKQALLRLEESKSSPFDLFIASFKLPKMEGDDIHKHAKTISPMTQRMLMVPADEPDMVIRAINKGGINSCIIYPFQDEDLLNQAKNCLVQFRRSMKRQQLKRVTTHQNQQLLKIAQKLKKKNEACQKLIAEKKAERLMRNSTLRKALKQKAPDKDFTLGKRIEKNDIPVTPDGLGNEFLILCDYIKALFDASASKLNLNPFILDLHALILKESKTAVATTSAIATGTAAAVAAAAVAAAAVAVDAATDSPGNASSDLVQKILTLALTSQPGIAIDTDLQKTNALNQDADTSLNAYIELSFSKDLTTASIQKIKGMDLPDILTLSSLMDFLQEQNIIFGIVEDKAIEEGILRLKTEVQSLIVAKGEKPVSSENGSIKFHFENDFTNPGKIQEDGTIDFRDRGEIPYVSIGAFLAEKTPAKEGKNGMDVLGNPILADPAL
ncbi:MAG: FapA family protein, partial [Desulfobacterium sp.]